MEEINDKTRLLRRGFWRSHSLRQPEGLQGRVRAALGRTAVLVLTCVAVGTACSKVEPGISVASDSAKPVVPAPCASVPVAPPPASASAATEPPTLVPTAIASGQGHPLRVVVDAANVYWINQGTGDKPAPRSGSVMRVPKAGGDPVELTKKQDMPTGIAVDATNVYWSTTEAVRKVKTEGGTVATLYTSPPGAGVPMDIKLDEGNVYFAVLHASKGGLFKVAKSGGGAKALAGGDEDSGITVNDYALFLDNAYACIGVGNVLARINLKMKHEKVVLDTLKKCENVASSDDSVVWTETTGGIVSRLHMLFLTAPKPKPTKVADANHPTHVVVNDREVFFVERPGRIMRAPIGGGKARVVVELAKSPDGIAVDDENVYWASRDEGTIFRVARR